MTTVPHDHVLGQLYLSSMFNLLLLRIPFSSRVNVLRVLYHYLIKKCKKIVVHWHCIITLVLFVHNSPSNMLFISCYSHPFYVILFVPDTILHAISDLAHAFFCYSQRRKVFSHWRYLCLIFSFFFSNNFLLIFPCTTSF
jgi:hypothetical protein